MDFSFIHAADLHLDSPLIGLGRKSLDYAEVIHNASRQAFDNLVNLAIDENCRFLLIAGDVFDGEWKDYRSGLFFADRMRILHEAGVNVYLILGNHDAENRFMKRLEFAPNVRLFGSQEAESIMISDLDVVLHGQSFPRNEVTENIAQFYPTPVSGYLNIGLLHTACTGIDGHANYAPCSLEQLSNQGYDYWALGHVHRHQVLMSDPYIVFSGNLQGRHARETGVKGVVKVGVSNGIVSSVSHIPLDVVRWYNEQIDLTGVDELSTAYSRIHDTLKSIYQECDGRGLAIRLRLAGDTSIHNSLLLKYDFICEEIETIVVNIGNNIWIESIDVATQPPKSAQSADATIAGRVADLIDSLSGDAQLADFLDKKIGEIKAKLPSGAKSEELFADIRTSVFRAAAEHAKARLDGSNGGINEI